MRSNLTAMLAALVLVACAGGDDDGGGGAYDGFWLFNSVTVDDGGGPVTVTRDGGSLAVRGDARFETTGGNSGVLDVRIWFLVDGLTTQEEVSAQSDLAVEVDGSIWVIENAADSSTTVFDTSLAGDTLALTYLPDDPRNVSDNDVTELTLTKATPWTTASQGSWELASITFPLQGTYTPADCIDQGGGTWVTINMDVTIDTDWVFHRDMTLTAFSDDTCTTQTQQQVDPQVGWAEEENGDLLRVWTFEAGSLAGELIEFDLTFNGNEITLDRASCLPSPACEGEVPEQVVMVAQ